MKDPDYSEYEKRRAEAHEDAWRLAATFVNIRSRRCRYRICRRHQFCLGPMLPSPHQSGVIRAHKEIGLNGTACADLPMCMANTTSDYYACIRDLSQEMKNLRDGKLKHLERWEFLLLIQNDMRKEHRTADLTSPARQPTSGAEYEG